MVTLAVREQTLFSETTYIPVEVALSEFEILPKSLYIRGEIDKSESTVKEYQANLLFPEDKKNIVKVIDPLVWFSLSEEQAASFGFADVQAGTKYWLNGNNRFYAIGELYTNPPKDVEFAEIPIKELNNAAITLELLMRLQSSFNDTTKPHSTLSRIIAIGNLYRRYVQQGMKASVANTMVRSVMGITEVYISQAKKFVETSSGQELTEEQKRERETLFDLVGKEYFSVDVGISIMQTAEVLDLSIPFIVRSLIAAYGGEIESGRLVPVSKTQFTNWRKDYERRMKQTADPTAEGEEPTAEGEEPTAEGQKEKER